MADSRLAPSSASGCLVDPGEHPKPLHRGQPARAVSFDCVSGIANNHAAVEHHDQLHPTPMTESINWIGRLRIAWRDGAVN